jgi:hypothetical protein
MGRMHRTWVADRQQTDSAAGDDDGQQQAKHAGEKSREGSQKEGQVGKLVLCPPACAGGQSILMIHLPQNY